MNNSFISKITNWKVLLPVMVVAALAVMAVTLVAKSNADYICTRIIDDESACTIDEWSQWADATSTDPEGERAPGTTYEVPQRRIGTGTKTLSRVIEYINRRTACVAGFTQASAGTSGGGAGGYNREGKTFTTSAVCQLEQERNITRRVPGGTASTTDPECIIGTEESCTITVGVATTTTEVTSTTTVTGGDEIALDSLEEILAFRRANIKAKITVNPVFVSAYGESVIVKWRSTETKSCTVDGSNGDAWTPVTGGTDNNGVTIEATARTSGEELTSPINGKTTYVLRCIAFDDSVVTSRAVVERVPGWQED